MVAPTPFFNVGVDFGPLITKLEADLVPIAKTAELQPLAKTAELQPLAKTADLQPLAKTADLQPLATTADLQPLATTADLQPLAKTADLQPLAKTTDLGTLATKEDIRQLRWLVLKLWWLDHMCRHVTHEGAAQSVPAAALFDLDLRTTRGLASVTAKQIEELAEKTLHEQFRLPLDEYEKMLGAFKPVAENLARQQASPTQSRTTSRSPHT
jgi:hypothetical protein